MVYLKNHRSGIPEGVSLVSAKKSYLQKMKSARNSQYLFVIYPYKVPLEFYVFSKGSIFVVRENVLYFTFTMGGVGAGAMPERRGKKREREQ